MFFLNQNYISVLPWPALLPDLSPIEQLWDELVIRVRHRQNPTETLPAQQIWQYQQKFSTSLSEHIMDRHKLSCSMEVC
jgi:transposase